MLKTKFLKTFSKYLNMWINKVLFKFNDKTNNNAQKKKNGYFNTIFKKNIKMFIILSFFLNKIYFY